MRQRIIFTLLLALFSFALPAAYAQAPKPEPAKELPGTIEVCGNEFQASFQFTDQDTLLVTLPGFDVTIAEPGAIFGAYSYEGTTCGCIATNTDSPLGEPTLWVYWVSNGTSSTAQVYVPEHGATYTTGDERLLYAVPEPFCKQVLRENHEIVTGQRGQFSFRQ